MSILGFMELKHTVARLKCVIGLEFCLLHLSNVFLYFEVPPVAGGQSQSGMQVNARTRLVV